jgi:SAM-dependent methyltransferase
LNDPRPLHALDPLLRFADRAADYARARPSYPKEAIGWILEPAGLPTAPASGCLVVADIGAGTGIMSRLIADATTAGGGQVIAIEPNPAMRAAAEPHARVEWREGTGEATGLPSGSVDIVVCAQAFHWMRPTAALAEFARIGRGGARLAIVVNERDPSDDVTRRYGDALKAVVDHELSEGMAAQAETALAAAGLVVERRSFAYRHRLEREDWFARAFSASYVPREGARAQRLREELGRIFDAWPEAVPGEPASVHMVYATKVLRVALERSG